MIDISKEFELTLYQHEDISSFEKFSMSKLTECLIYSFQSTLKNSKNLVIVYPENIFRPSVLLAYHYMKNYSKDVLCLTVSKGDDESNLYKKHLQNFCLMQEKNKYGLIWNYYVPCILNEGLNVEIIFRESVTNKAKSGFKKQLQSKLKSPRYNKLIFSKKMINANVLESISKIIFDKESYDYKNELGLCIFENLSNKVYTLSQLDSFLNWSKPLLENVQMVFHISEYTNINFINKIAKNTNSVVLYISPDFLFKTNNLFYEKSCVSSNKYSISLSHNYNLDSPMVYSKNENRIIPIMIDGNGIETSEIREMIHSIKKNKLLLKNTFSLINRITFLLPKLTLHPNSLGRFLTYTYPNGQIKKISLENFFEEFEITIRTAENGFDILEQIRDKLLQLYNTLNETDRFAEKQPFTRKSKPIVLLELINSLLKEHDNKITIAVYDSREKNILSKVIDQYFHDGPKNINKIDVRTINGLSHSSANIDSNILVIPSFLISRYFSEYFKPYKKIYVLCYYGEEEIALQKQLNLINYASSEYSDRSISYFEELYELLHWKKDKFLEDIIALKCDKKREIDTDILDIIKNRILKDKDFEYLKDHEDIFEDSEDTSFFDRLNNAEASGYTLILSSIETGKIKPIQLSRGKSLLFINEREDIEEKAVNELKEGDKILLIEGDEKKSLVDYIAKKMGIEDEIDLYHIKLWKEKLNKFIEEQNLTNQELYILYKVKGGRNKTNPFPRWKDSLINIAPSQKHDLLIMAKLIDYPYLVENIDDIFDDITLLRTSHRQIGRQLNAVIKQKLSGKLDNQSFEDYDISNQLKIYDVIKIGKPDQ